MQYECIHVGQRTRIPVDDLVRARRTRCSRSYDASNVSRAWLQRRSYSDLHIAGPGRNLVLGVPLFGQITPQSLALRKVEGTLIVPRTCLFGDRRLPGNTTVIGGEYSIVCQRPRSGCMNSWDSINGVWLHWGSIRLEYCPIAFEVSIASRPE